MMLNDTIISSNIFLTCFARRSEKRATNVEIFEIVLKILQSITKSFRNYNLGVQLPQYVSNYSLKIEICEQFTQPCHFPRAIRHTDINVTMAL